MPRKAFWKWNCLGLIYFNSGVEELGQKNSSQLNQNNFIMLASVFRHFRLWRMIRNTFKSNSPSPPPEVPEYLWSTFTTCETISIWILQLLCPYLYMHILLCLPTGQPIQFQKYFYCYCCTVFSECTFSKEAREYYHSIDTWILCPNTWHNIHRQKKRRQEED